MGSMVSPRTGAERYLQDRMKDPEFARAYRAARQRTSQFDEVIRTLDHRRCSLDLSKAELARRAGLRPDAVRRLFSAESPNPTLATVVALASALDLELTAKPLEGMRVSRAQSDAVEIRPDSDVFGDSPSGRQPAGAA